MHAREQRVQLADAFRQACRAWLEDVGRFHLEIRFSRAADTASHPDRSQIDAFLTFFPHHDAKMTSGSRRATSAGSTMRSRPTQSKW